MQHAKIRPFSLKQDYLLFSYSKIACLLLSFDKLFMFLGHANPILCVSVNATVKLCKITEPRKKRVKSLKFT